MKIIYIILFLSLLNEINIKSEISNFNIKEIKEINESKKLKEISFSFYKLLKCKDNKDYNKNNKNYKKEFDEFLNKSKENGIELFEKINLDFRERLVNQKKLIDEKRNNIRLLFDEIYNGILEHYNNNNFSSDSFQTFDYFEKILNNDEEEKYINNNDKLFIKNLNNLKYHMSDEQINYINNNHKLVIEKFLKIFNKESFKNFINKDDFYDDDDDIFNDLEENEKNLLFSVIDINEIYKKHTEYNLLIKDYNWRIKEYNVLIKKFKELYKNK